MDLHAEAMSFADPEVQATVINILHNAHVRSENLHAFRNAEPINDLSTVAALS